LQEVQESALIIGGIAVGYHGLERTTNDVDILYKNRDTLIVQRLETHFEPVVSAESGWHEMRHRRTRVRLKLVPEGGLGQDGFIPFCDTVGGQDGFISLNGLVWLKLVAGRGKDEVDVVELYKRNSAGVAAARTNASSGISRTVRCARFKSANGAGQRSLSPPRKIHETHVARRHDR
jgi:hypothetical protein